MIIKTGVDIIEVDRIQEAIESQREAFLHKVYTQKEIDYCGNTGKMIYQHYAVRFAAKEAVYKAISEVISPNLHIFIGMTILYMFYISFASGFVKYTLTSSKLKEYNMYENNRRKR